MRKTLFAAASLALAAAVAWAGPPATAPAATTGPGVEPTTRPLVLDLGDKVTMTLLWVPAGRFTMGSPPAEAGRRDDEAQHDVKLTRPFYLGRTLVTQEQYQAVMGRNPSQVNRGAAYPVDSVSWNDAAAFCDRLGQKTHRKTALPTEAQWEYACRAGTQERFFCGNDEKPLRDCALFWARTDLPVARFKPNPWGLYDMLGELHEWCADWHGPYPDKEAADPTGPADGRRRVLRGGCFHNSAQFCRCASRVHYPPGQADYDFGFRVAVALEPQDDGSGR